MFVRGGVGVATILACLVATTASSAAACNGTPGDGTTPPGERAGSIWLGNGELWTFALVRIVARPGGSSLPAINADGSITDKYLWLGKRTSETPPLKRLRLVITGRRLDGSGRFKKSRRGGGWNSKALYWPGYLTFPTPGCWQVTGRLNKRPRLRFVVAVEPPPAPPATARAW